jgi:hypothetical protein
MNEPTKAISLRPIEKESPAPRLEWVSPSFEQFGLKDALNSGGPKTPTDATIGSS